MNKTANATLLFYELNPGPERLAGFGKRRTLVFKILSSLESCLLSDVLLFSISHPSLMCIDSCKNAYSWLIKQSWGVIPLWVWEKASRWFSDDAIELNDCHLMWFPKDSTWPPAKDSFYITLRNQQWSSWNFSDAKSLFQLKYHL